MPYRERPFPVHGYARKNCSLLGQSLRSGIRTQNKLSQFRLTISSFELYVYFKQMSICCIRLMKLVHDYETYLAEKMTTLMNVVVEGGNASM